MLSAGAVESRSPPRQHFIRWSLYAPVPSSLSLSVPLSFTPSLPLPPFPHIFLFLPPWRRFCQFSILNTPAVSRTVSLILLLSNSHSRPHLSNLSRSLLPHLFYLSLSLSPFLPPSIYPWVGLSPYQSWTPQARSPENVEIPVTRRRPLVESSHQQPLVVLITSSESLVAAYPVFAQNRCSHDDIASTIYTKQLRYRKY